MALCGDNRCDRISNDLAILLSTMKTKILVFAALLLFATLPTEAQCAMCRAVIESEEEWSVGQRSK